MRVIVATATGLLGFLLTLLLFGCVQNPQPPRAEGTAEPREFPSFVYNSAQVLQAYQIALAIPEVLPAIPCYCNCGKAQEHTSLKDCFFRPDGSLNDHGAFCDICTMEAADVARWHQEGNDLRQIRAKIEEKYPPYGEPTNTPPIA